VSEGRKLTLKLAGIGMLYSIAGFLLYEHDSAGYNPFWIILPAAAFGLNAWVVAKSIPAKWDRAERVVVSLASGLAITWLTFIVYSSLAIQAFGG